MKKRWLCTIAAAAIAVAMLSANVVRASTGVSSLKFDVPSLSVDPGGTGSTKVAVALTSGQTAKVDLKLVESANPLTVTFTPSSGSPPFTSTMTVYAPRGTEPGTRTIKIHVIGDAPSEIVAYSVTVKSGSGGY